MHKQNIMCSHLKVENVLVSERNVKVCRTPVSNQFSADNVSGLKTIFRKKDFHCFFVVVAVAFFFLLLLRMFFRSSHFYFNQSPVKTQTSLVWKSWP